MHVQGAVYNIHCIYQRSYIARHSNLCDLSNTASFPPDEPELLMSSWSPLTINNQGFGSYRYAPNGGGKEMHTG